MRGCSPRFQWLGIPQPRRGRAGSLGFRLFQQSPRRTFTSTGLSHAAVATTTTAHHTSAQPPNHESLAKAQRVEYYLTQLATRLPLHLRHGISSVLKPSASVDEDSSSRQNALEIGKLLLEARRPSHTQIPLDPLHELAVTKGQWTAVVWIVRLLLEHFHAESLPTDKLSQLVEQQILPRRSLKKLTSNPLKLIKPHELDDADSTAPKRLDLDALTETAIFDTAKPHALSSHSILGTIWHTLGTMTLSCVSDKRISGGAMKPEILEILAMFHHHGFMPSSIYNYTPAKSPDAIQQPPTLHLLSSQIMASLTDAAWRAHERTIVEEAKLKHGINYIDRPELPATSYRINVGAIRPEIWLELILWSCLHGGWIADGADVLRAICDEEAPNAWEPTSWRESLRAILPFGQTNLVDWEQMKNVIDTKPSSSMDLADLPGLRLERTISSELVNAFVEALLNTVHIGVGQRGFSYTYVLLNLRIYRDFLQRSALNLHSGSWDAILLRLVDINGTDATTRKLSMAGILKLSPGIGQELHSRHTQALPSYVLDGSAAMLGLMHRWLRGQIKLRSISGATKVFTLIQEHVDDARRRSIADFFDNKRSTSGSSKSPSSELFTSNFAGIEHPAFDAQIPPIVMAEFIDFLAEAKAFDLGRSLFDIDRIDGPIVPEQMYGDAVIAPALIKYATEAGDAELMRSVIRARAATSGASAQKTASKILRALLDNQLTLRRYDRAIRILELLRDDYNGSWNTITLAVLAKDILTLRPSSTHEVAVKQEELRRARELFDDMISGVYSSRSSASEAKAQKVNIVQLLAVASVADLEFARCLQQFSITSPVRATTRAEFHLILEGVARSEGSIAARRLLDTFWPEHMRPSPSTKAGHQAYHERMPRSRPMDTARKDSYPNMFIISAADGRALTMRTPLQPNLTTIRIILRQALQELKPNMGQPIEGREGAETSQDRPWKATYLPDEISHPRATETPERESTSKQHRNTSPFPLLMWASNTMKVLMSYDAALTFETITQDLQSTIDEVGMPELKVLLPSLVK